VDEDEEAPQRITLVRGRTALHGASPWWHRMKHD
jgi:hypothetical protein